jgi:hypothetical protein
LTTKYVQQRDHRWCIVDLVGKHGRVRTIPMPAWVKNAIDAWTEEVGVAEGHVFRLANRSNQVCGERMTEKVVWQMRKTYVDLSLRGVTSKHTRKTWIVHGSSILSRQGALRRDQGSGGSNPLLPAN